MARKVKLNPSAARKIMNSPGVKAELNRRAAKIAAAAGPGMDAVNAEEGTERARASVYTATRQGREREAKDRALTRAIDAGRR